ncbi:MAG: hypothetical protein NVS1B7_3550 [Candidatus Saccharimonadales bacterium]
MTRNKKHQPSKKNKSSVNTELDSVYFLKLVMYLIVGSIWLKITNHDTAQIPIPIGLIIGIFFARHEHFQIDRKIEIAVLLIAMLVGFWAPFGLFWSM